MKRLLLALALCPSLALAQTTEHGGASVMVTDIQTADILAANNIDKAIPGNLAGRLAFKILAHEWLALNQTDPNTILPNTNQMTLSNGLNLMLEDGQQGEMARASMAGMIGYTPQSLGTAIQTLLRDMGVEGTLTIQRSQFNGPEWIGTISVRDTARIGVALTRLHGESMFQMAAGADLQCFSYAVGPKSDIAMTAIVSGAASPEGCLAAARQALELSDTRLSNRTRVDES